MYLRILVLLAAAACSNKLPDAPAPDLNSFYLPESVVAHPGGRYVYVLNTNADGRYTSPYVNIVDVQTDTIVGDAGRLLVSRPGLAAIDRSAKHLFIPLRGDGTLAIFDVVNDGAMLDCRNAEEDSQLECAEQLPDPIATTFPAPDQPYAALTFRPQASTREFLAVTHLATAGISVLALPTLDTMDNGVFAGDAFESVASPAVASVPDGRGGSDLYLADLNSAAVEVLGSQWIQSSGASGNTGQVADAGSPVALVAAPSGRLLYIAESQPNAVAAVDFSMLASGARTSVDLPGAPIGIAYVGGNQKGGPDLLYVSSFEQGEVYVLDATTLKLLTTLTDLPGATSLAVSQTADGPIVTLSLYSQNGVAIIDATPGDPTAHYVRTQL